MKASALGIHIGIVPTFTGSSYLCVAFDRHGNWRSAAMCATREEAAKMRSELFARHRLMKRQDDQKKRRKRR